MHVNPSDDERRTVLIETDTPGIADEAIATGEALWLQLGVTSEDAAARATAAGLVVVMNKWIGATHRHLHVPKKG